MKRRNRNISQFHVYGRNLEFEKRYHQREKLATIGQLAGGIAHNINSQLAGVMGYADLIRLGLYQNKPDLTVQPVSILMASQRASDCAPHLLS